MKNMTDSLDIASNHILAPVGLDEGGIQRVLDSLLGHAVDFADLYFESSRAESWLLEDGIVKEGRHNIDQGVGVRAISGEKTGFAYSDEIVPAALLDAAGTARAIATRGGKNKVQAWRRQGVLSFYDAGNPLHSMTASDKAGLLRELDAAARQSDPRIKQVMVSLTAIHDIALIASSDGTYTADVRPLVRLNVSAVAEQHGRRETGTWGGGGRFGYEWFLDRGRAKGFAREAARQALLNLEAEDAPAGTMTVVLGPGWP